MATSAEIVPCQRLLNDSVVTSEEAAQCAGRCARTPAHVSPHAIRTPDDRAEAKRFPQACGNIDVTAGQELCTPPARMIQGDTVASPMTIAPTLDEDVLRSIRDVEDDGAAGLLEMLAAAFLDDAGGRIEQLRGAIAQRQTGQIKEAAHSLKGMCGAIGALRMHQISGELEHPDASLDDQQLRLTELEEEFGRVRCALARS